MNYTEFTENLKQKIEEQAEPGAEVTFHRIPKNNGVKMDAFTVLMPGETIAPAVYIRDYFQKYKEGVKMEELAKILLKNCRKCRNYTTFPAGQLRDFQNIRHRIRYRLVNYQMNKELLQDIPHSRVLDLACMYYYDLICPNNERGTIIIKNRDLDIWNISEFDLQKIAAQNTPRISPAELLPMRQALGTDADPDDDDEIPMYVLTNRERIFGASCLLYKDILLPLAESLHSNLFILPSSIHELILTPDRGYMSKTDFEKMVREINRTQVELYEVLSDHVYYYERSERRIIM